MEFLDANGLAENKLMSESVQSLQHDLGEFDVVIALQGRVRDYIGTAPFHTTALHWDMQAEGDLLDEYRFLHEKITALIDLLAGEEAA
jgi:hypothetical protein